MPQNNPKSYARVTRECPSCGEPINNRSACTCGLRFRADGSYFLPRKATKTTKQTRPEKKLNNKENLTNEEKSHEKATNSVENTGSQKSLKSHKKASEKGPDLGEKGTGKKDGFFVRIWKEWINI